MANRKFGIETPTSEKTRETLSSQPSGRTAESTPKGTDNTTANKMASTANSRVRGNRVFNSVITWALNQVEFPKSPLMAPPIQSTYWTAIGRSVPNLCRRSSSSFWV